MFGDISNNIDKAKSSLTCVIELTKPDMDKVNEIILAMARSHTSLIDKISTYLAQAGGKRIRPMLTIAVAKLFGVSASDQAIKLAAAVEFMHTATLLHDDVVDESDMRRGQKAARKIWGNQASVLVGDFLLGQAFNLMVDVGSMEALKVLAQAASVIAEGEVMQLVAAKSLESSIDDYFKIIDAKTAELFSAATSVGAIIAGASASDQHLITAYGRNIGIAFQLVDDILDYNGDSTKLGKNTGDDFREGKITLPVLLAVQNGDSEEKAFWRQSLCEGQSSPDNFAKALMLLHKHNSLQMAAELAKSYGRQAEQALMALKNKVDAKVYEILLEIIEFCISRVE